MLQLMKSVDDKIFTEMRDGFNYLRKLDSGFVLFFDLRELIITTDGSSLK